MPKEFFRLTWGQYNCRVRGWMRLDEDKWEHTRLLYSILYNVNADEKDRKTPAQLLPLRKDRRAALLSAPDPVAAEAARRALIERIKKRDNLN
ncbi:hypothetical protein I5L79_02310 [Hymenobacter sp. BT594]|uniref:Uncharacterized protein n=1 Tax=Hymenobacter guriensis TaxID=2793065 RepID=A0ABS0KYD0_9BACT|nr:hypothetical protein [Hymenobacter guriensis]